MMKSNMNLYEAELGLWGRFIHEIRPKYFLMLPEFGFCLVCKHVLVKADFQVESSAYFRTTK